MNGKNLTRRQKQKIKRIEVLFKQLKSEGVEPLIMEGGGWPQLRFFRDADLRVDALYEHNTITQWTIEDFFSGFWNQRVWVPDWIFTLETTGSIAARDAEIERLREALGEINNVCGTVSFSSHIQMKEAITAAVEISEQALTKNNNHG